MVPVAALQSPAAPDLQLLLAQLMKGKPGAAAVLDVASGKPLASWNLKLAAQRLAVPGSTELAEVDAKNADDLVRALKASPQLSYVSFLPALLVPEKRTVPYLREAAPRVQADLLFVYNTRIETFRRDRFFKSPDEVHAQCIAESVLLDVRTGIVLQTGHGTENIALKKTAADANFSETVARGIGSAGEGSDLTGEPGRSAPRRRKMRYTAPGMMPRMRAGSLLRMTILLGQEPERTRPAKWAVVGEIGKRGQIAALHV